MALSWDVQPKNGIEEFFSHEMYNCYSLAPTFLELCEMVNRQTAGISDSVEVQQQPKTSPKLDSTAPASGSTTNKSSEAIFPLPEPRVSYPRFSALTERDQKNYVQFMQKFKNMQQSTWLQGKMYGHLAQYLGLKNIVWSEMQEFMKYLQNVARTCAEDYDVISHDAVCYTEAVLQAWNENLKRYPELYIVNEITSIMGGKFIPDLTLQLEKKLLCLGQTLYLRVPTIATSNQLTTDYKTITSFTPPSAVRASAIESGISNDVNAEKLSVKYGAKVSLTRQALFTLLNNCGPKYTEPWEIPIHVKTICGEGNKTEKVVFIESPLPKKELGIRERNLLFYEVPLDLMMSKKSYTSVSNLTLDKPQSSISFEENQDQRSVNACTTSDLDFNADFTELETFGTISSGLTKKTLLKDVVPSTCRQALKPKAATTAPTTGDNKEQDLTKTQSPAEVVTKKLIQDDQLPSSLSNPNCGRELNTVENTDCRGPSISDQQKGNPKKEVRDQGDNETLASDNKNEQANFKGMESDSNSDEDQLIIDTNIPVGSDSCNIEQTAGIDMASIPEKLDHQDPKEIVPDTPRSPSPDQSPPSSQKPRTKRLTRKRTASKTLQKEFDPVGQILRMQCKLLKSSPKKPVDQPQATQESSSLCHNPPGQPSLDRNPITVSVPDSDTSTFGNVSSFLEKTPQNTKTGLLSEDLLNCEEAASDYISPSSGNVIYKLFSLSDLLILVRGSICKTQIRPRSNKGGRKKHVPVYVLPKLEYQSMYGIEAFTESEICQLWTESLINSNSWFYIGHIDAFTSKLILIDQFPAASMMSKLGSFNPVNSLNILHHILRKVTSLPEDRYLLSHSSGDSSFTIYRTSRRGKFTRAAYNLHAAHSALPSVPSTLSVPWVPLDPDVLLPYHIHHGRVPCTFPPRPVDNLQNQKMGVAKAKRDILAQGEAVTKETKGHPSSTKQTEKQDLTTNKKKKKKRQGRMKKWRAKLKARKAQDKQGQ
ncbi:little elongation complex subunit 2 isoform X2 [Hypanus sabinus]|uniref:little elongation complex subunit 2 isoform X2 n=1 Tax=Hypanus sabinus TaxID=79690 RepID=UPI0028C3C62B|nr:little elongation complex subunit 2 isoform X2 [Hypanus sabinus]